MTKINIRRGFQPVDAESETGMLYSWLPHINESVIEIRRVHCKACGSVKREKLDFLADNPLYTRRFAWFVGRRYRQSSIKDVAQELNLD